MTGLAEVWNLRLLVHLGADAVAHILLHHAKAVAAGVLFHRGADVPQAVARLGGLDSQLQTALGHLHQLLALGGGASGGHRKGVVAVEALVDGPCVNADDVPLLDLPALGRNPVDDLLVYRDAGRCGEPAVSQEGGGGPKGEDHIVDRPVHIHSGGAGPYRLYPCHQGQVGDPSGLPHQLQLPAGFQDDHSWPSKALRVASVAASMVVLPSISESFPWLR